MKNTKMNKLALAIGSLVMAGGVMAANTFNATASISGQCVVSTTQAMAFNGLTMLDATTGGLSTAKNNATANFDATCTNGGNAPTLKFVSSSGGGSAFGMLNQTALATEVIEYTLFEGTLDTGTSIAHNVDAAFTGFVADGTVKSLSVTGKVLPADKNGKPIASYSDTVTITATFVP
ncbi:MAG: Spore coat domain protein [Burkholderia sp.]|nr:Spore coat domain protein [Burkholderia sp.]